MRLICINSNSSGNAFALDAGEEILLLEAGVRLPLVSRSIDFRTDKVVGCLISHIHGDHAKYAEEYTKHGVKVYCNSDVSGKIKFMFGSCKVMEYGKTYHIGKFSVIPFDVHHDVPTYSFIVHHPEMGNLAFITDTYNMDFYLKNIDHWLVEANYSDDILKKNVWEGRIDRGQANRLMLSHMSLNNTVHYLQECQAEKSKTITLCHLSERNSDHDIFLNTVAGAFGVPTYVASKGTIVELIK